MGRQIDFYMDESTQMRFLEYVKSNHFVLLSCKGEKIEDSNDYYVIYLYKNEFGNLLFKNQNQLLDILNSPIIELIKTRIKGHKVLCGRLWVSDSFYKHNTDKMESCKNYIDAYKLLSKWIKTNVPYQEVMMGGYIIKTYADDLFVDIENRGFQFSS